MRRNQPHEAHVRDIAGASWDPGQFADHRLRPAVDLMGRIPLADPRRIYDLGCGIGNVTRMLADRWPSADVVGTDHSPQMLEQARSTPSRVRRQHGDLADWKPEETPSLLFSNAVIHWLPDHRSLIGRLWSLLPPGGCLAVQAPMTWDLPSHRVMREPLAGGGEGGTPLDDTALRRARAPGCTTPTITTTCWPRTPPTSMCGRPSTCTPSPARTLCWSGSRPPACARSCPALAMRTAQVLDDLPLLLLGRLPVAPGHLPGERLAPLHGEPHLL